MSTLQNCPNIYLFVALEALSALTVDEPADPFTTPSQLDSELITLTLLPRSRWQTLLHLEVIQVSSYNITFNEAS